MSEVSVTGSTAVVGFVTTTVKVTGPPGSATSDGAAPLSTVTRGFTSTMVTSAVSFPVAVLFSLSVAVAVTVSGCFEPASPCTGAVNVQL